jgi:hypothetical protein
VSYTAKFKLQVHYRGLVSLQLEHTLTHAQMEQNDSKICQNLCSFHRKQVKSDCYVCLMQTQKSMRLVLTEMTDATKMARRLDTSTLNLD